MHDVKSGTFGDLLSLQAGRREDIQFGTVSDILTVSSSVQYECEQYVEELSENVGVSIEEVLSNDFKPLKLKKGKKPSKRVEKQIVSPNRFDLLVHEDFEIKEINRESLENTSVGSKTLPWKTVLKSKQRNGESKCLKYKLKNLKAFETKNPFKLLENICGDLQSALF